MSKLENTKYTQWQKYTKYHTSASIKYAAECTRHQHISIILLLAVIYSEHTQHKTSPPSYHTRPQRFTFSSVLSYNSCKCSGMSMGWELTWEMFGANGCAELLSIKCVAKGLICWPSTDFTGVWPESAEAQICYWCVGKMQNVSCSTRHLLERATTRQRLSWSRTESLRWKSATSRGDGLTNATRMILLQWSSGDWERGRTTGSSTNNGRLLNGSRKRRRHSRGRRSRTLWSYRCGK